MTILHFAGSSPHKNTLENCQAGIDITRRLNQQIDRDYARRLSSAADSNSSDPSTSSLTLTPPSRFHFTCFLCSWPSTKRVDAGEKFAVGSQVIEILRDLAVKHSDIFTLIASGFMSYAARTRLLESTRLALCASRCEGFGHYILESAAAGCMVATSNAPPMNSILSVDGTYSLAQVECEEQQCYGYGYTIKPDAIVEAAMKLPLTEATGYSSKTIELCIQNETNATAKFNQGIQTLKARLTHEVTKRKAKTSSSVVSPPSSSSSSTMPPMKRGVFHASHINSSADSLRLNMPPPGFPALAANSSTIRQPSPPLSTSSSIFLNFAAALLASSSSSSSDTPHNHGSIQSQHSHTQSTTSPIAR